MIYGGKINNKYTINFEDFEAERDIETFKKLYGEKMFEQIIEHLINEINKDFSKISHWIGGLEEYPDAENIYNVGLPKPRSIEESDAMMWLGINNIGFQIEYKDGKAGTYIFLSGDII